MITLDFEDLMLEIDDGTVKHVGTSNTAATVKLYHVDDAEARVFGDSVKLAFADGEGNEVEVAVSPDAAAALHDDLGELVEDGD